MTQHPTHQADQHIARRLARRIAQIACEMAEGKEEAWQQVKGWVEKLGGEWQEEWQAGQVVRVVVRVPHNEHPIVLSPRLSAVTACVLLNLILFGRQWLTTLPALQAVKVVSTLTNQGSLPSERNFVPSTNLMPKEVEQGCPT